MWEEYLIKEKGRIHLMLLKCMSLDYGEGFLFYDLGKESWDKQIVFILPQSWEIMHF